MASLPHSTTVTYEEWLRMPEVQGEEVVNGEIRKMPAPRSNHARIIQRINTGIARQVDESKVEVFSSPFDLIIRRQPLTARQPDLAVFLRNTIVENDGRIFSPPQLVVEVRSPANRPTERARKLVDYASLGVPEVWALSEKDRSVEVLYLEQGEYRRQALLTEGILKPPHFAGVQIDIAAIWPD